jgi:hypothetical protein
MSLSDVDLRIVEKGETTDFRGRKVTILSYFVFYKGKKYPEWGQPAHIFVAEGEDINKKIQEAKVEALKALKVMP